ncbi:protein proton gradient regulation 5 chloroplastic [Phtheirospermum japonicum]|uniref:Protein proton gradient regulation 5 chloroplastic n=1 Tax=Phtheirospermum japonicum TaxID=374723 RepID=A0A830BGT0_9LAMI|nr:protein proton gradient regulation 5 chloroplastic [Phtheirospermum japonicum]
MSASVDHVMLQAKAAPPHARVLPPVRAPPVMMNVNEGNGLFAPIVVVMCNIFGKKQFNQLRGRAIAPHSQVITQFCKSIGADSKPR